MSPGGDFHRYEEQSDEGAETADPAETARRVALALGRDPVPDARHLLTPVPLPPAAPPPPDGPHPGTEFNVDLSGRFPQPVAVVRAALAPEKRVGWGAATVWAQQTARPNHWRKLDDIPEDGRLSALTVSWELASLLVEGTEAIALLAGYVLRVGEQGKTLGLDAVPRETPEVAARRAAELTEIRFRYSHAVEMRLMPQGRAFPARAVWRAAYALGMNWGDRDLFYWPDPVAERRLFRMNAVGQPGYFLPERAAEGQGIAGIALSFDLPFAPAPLATFDRMGVALAYFRQTLGGRPLTPDGSELDAERLWDDRERLQEAVHDMARAGIAPGSPEAARLF